MNLTAPSGARRCRLSASSTKSSDPARSQCFKAENQTAAPTDRDGSQDRRDPLIWLLRRRRDVTPPSDGDFASRKVRIVLTRCSADARTPPLGRFSPRFFHPGTIRLFNCSHEVLPYYNSAVSRRGVEIALGLSPQPSNRRRKNKQLV